MTILLTIAIVGALMAAMAVGVMVHGRSLKGSCGGPGAADCACDAAGTPNACATGLGPNGKARLKGRPVDDGVVVYD